jgi:Sulfatase
MLLWMCAIAGVAVFLILEGALPPVAGMLAVALILTTGFWLLRVHLPSILLVFVTVLLVSVVVTRPSPKIRADRIEAQEGDQVSRKWSASGRFNQKLPIVVHLVFDEMMSVGAMTDDLPGGSAMRASLQAFGEKHSLRMFDSVYSRFFFSGVSLPNMMNTEYRGQLSLGDVLKTKSNLTANAYFDDMAARGYRTVVFQTALMNFCANQNVDLCETFDSFDPGAKGLAGLDARNQRASLWQTFITAYQPSYASTIGQAALNRIYGLRSQEVGVLGSADRYDAQRFPAWFDRFTRFAATVPRGTHLFAHFMVPHSPYLLSESCVVSGKFEGGYYLSNYPLSQRLEKRRRFYEGYFSQLRCVQRKLDDFMTTLEHTENFHDAVIIVHGDHGSRISSGNILEDYTQRDFVDNYATFFAVRSPAAAAGTDCEFLSLPEAFRRHAAAGVNKTPRTGAPLPVVVVSRAAGGSRVEAPMPLFGCAGGTASTP